MAYVVTESCIKCKFQDCVQVCPVDCFYTGENMLVIHPDECIDCGVCEPECPVVARSEEPTSALQSLMPISYPVRCFHKTNRTLAPPTPCRPAALYYQARQHAQYTI